MEIQENASAQQSSHSALQRIADEQKDTDDFTTIASPLRPKPENLEAGQEILDYQSLLNTKTGSEGLLKKNADSRYESGSP